MHARGFPEGKDADFVTIPIDGQGPMTDAVRSGEPVWIERVEQYCARYPESEEQVRPILPRAASVACLPIGTRRDTLGGLVFAFDDAREIDVHERAFLMVTARHCAQAISRERAAADLRRAVVEARRGYAAAKAADRRKDEFLAMLGHELRNPLSPILTALELMKPTDSEDTFGREREIIERQVRHVARLVDDLLDVSRATSGKILLEERVVDVADMVARSVERTSPLVEARHHRLVSEVPRTTLYVQGDEDRLTQVVTNLLTNAAKYTDPGGVIRVGGEREGDTVVLRVTDDGAGIPADLLPRVFDLFTQAPQSIARSAGGLGLGLSIARHLVELHGGEITAHSDGPGAGTEVVVRLPALGRLDAASTRKAPALPARPPLRVLVVDDNQDAAGLLVVALRRAGHDVIVAHDGPTAIERARGFEPDVALLDLGLPVMDGYELAERLRDEHGTALRLVAITGYGRERDRLRSRAVGFDQHLVKPAALGEVLLALWPESADLVPS